MAELFSHHLLDFLDQQGWLTGAPHAELIVELCHEWSSKGVLELESSAQGRMPTRPQSSGPLLTPSEKQVQLLPANDKASKSASLPAAFDFDDEEEGQHTNDPSKKRSSRSSKKFRPSIQMLINQTTFVENLVELLWRESWVMLITRHENAWIRCSLDRVCWPVLLRRSSTRHIDSPFVFIPCIKYLFNTSTILPEI